MTQEKTKRLKRGGVQAKNYVTHIMGENGRTLCGRCIASVNCQQAFEPVTEATCLDCARKPRVEIGKR